MDLKIDYHGNSTRESSSDITPDTDLHCPDILIPKKLIPGQPVIIKRDRDNYVQGTILDTAHNRAIIENTDRDLFGDDFDQLLPSQKEARIKDRSDHPFRFDVNVVGNRQRISEKKIKRKIDRETIYNLPERWEYVRVLSGGKSGAFIFLVHNSGQPKRILKLYPNAYTKKNLMREERCFREAYSLCSLTDVDGFPTVYKIGNCRWPSAWHDEDKRVPKSIPNTDLFLFVEMSSAKNDQSLELGSFDFKILNSLDLNNIDDISQRLLHLLDSAKEQLGDTFQHYDFHPDNIFVKFNKKIDDIVEDDRLTIESVDIIDFDLVDSSHFDRPEYNYHFDKSLNEHQTKKNGSPPERTVQFILQLIGIRKTYRLIKELGTIRKKLHHKIEKYQRKIGRIRDRNPELAVEDEEEQEDEQDGEVTQQIRLCRHGVGQERLQACQQTLDFYESQLRKYLNTDVRNWYVIMYALLTHCYEKECRRTDCRFARSVSGYTEKQDYLIRLHSTESGEKTTCQPNIPQLAYIKNLKKCNDIASCQEIRFNTENLDRRDSNIFSPPIGGRIGSLREDQDWMDLIPGISFLTKNQDLAASYLLFEDKVRCTTGFYPMADNVEIKCITTWNSNFKILVGAKPVTNLAQALRFDQNDNEIAKDREYLSFGLMNNPFMYDPNVGRIEYEKDRGNDITVRDLWENYRPDLIERQQASEALQQLEDQLNSDIGPGWTMVRFRRHRQRQAADLNRQATEREIDERKTQIERISKDIEYKFKTTILKKKVVLDESLRNRIRTQTNPRTDEPIRLIGNILNLTHESCDVRIKDTYEVVKLPHDTFNHIKLIKNNTAGKIQCITQIFFKQALPTILIDFKSLTNRLLSNVGHDGIFIEVYDLYKLLVKADIIKDDSIPYIKRLKKWMEGKQDIDLTTEYLDFTLLNTHHNAAGELRPGINIDNPQQKSVRISIDKFIIEYKTSSFIRITINSIISLFGRHVVSLVTEFFDFLNHIVPTVSIKIKDFISSNIPALSDMLVNIENTEISTSEKEQRKKIYDYLTKTLPNNTFQEFHGLFIETLMDGNYTKISPLEEPNRYLNDDQLSVIKTIVSEYDKKRNSRRMKITLDIHIPEADPHACFQKTNTNLPADRLAELKRECFQSLFSLGTGLLSNSPSLRQVISNILGNLDSFRWDMLYMPCKKGKWNRIRRTVTAENQTPVKNRGNCIDWDDDEKERYGNRPWVYGSSWNNCTTEIIKTGWNIANPNLQFFFLPTQDFIIDMINQNSPIQCCNSIEELAQFIQSAQIVLRDTPGDPRSLASDGVKRMLKNFVDRYYSNISQQLFDENFEENVRQFTRHQRHLGRLTRHIINR